MIVKAESHNKALKKKVEEHKAWLKENKDSVSPEEANVVKNMVEKWEEAIKQRKSKIKRDEQSVERLTNAPDNYIPHVVDPVMRGFTREHMPEIYDALGMAMNSMDNRFLKERTDYPFYMRNAVEAYMTYERRAGEQLTLDKIIADAYQDALLQGHVAGTPKGNYLLKYVEERLEGKLPGREAVVPTLEPVYDMIYKGAKTADMKTDLNVLSKLVEETRLIDKVQYDFLKENAKDFKSLNIEKVGDGKYGLTIQTLKPDIKSYDNLLTTARMQMYSGTIGMSPRTTALNIVSQPLMAAAHSGLPAIESLAVFARETKNAMALLSKKEFRQAMEDTGMTPTQRQVLNPEGGVGRQASTAYGKFIELSLSNMRYTEMVARFAVGRIGAIAYEKGLLPKERVGELVEVNGKKLSKKFSDEFNFEYTQDMAPLWTDLTIGGLPVGKAAYTLSSFGQKSLEVHGRIVKNADFLDWMKTSRDIMKDKSMNGSEKFANIYEAYKDNAYRIGLAKEAAFGLAAAMVMGQVFDIDWDEFLWGSVGFGISNPITNLFMGAGSFQTGLGGKLKPFIPGRGAVRGVDKMLGTDFLSDYQDYGNVPQLKDLLK